MSSRRGAAARGAGKDGKKAAPKKKKEKAGVDKYFREMEFKMLEDKLDRNAKHVSEVEANNAALKEQLAKQKEDQAQIFEYLKRELTQKEDEVYRLKDDKVAILNEKNTAVFDLEAALSDTRKEADKVQRSLNTRVKQLQEQLSELRDFEEHKEEVELELKQTKKALVQEQKEHQRIINDKNREVIQEKHKLTKEMKAKITDAKSTLLRMTEDSLETTTKRTIMENEQINAQLVFQSKQVLEMNKKVEKLQAENKRYRRENELLEQEQQVMAKKNASLVRLTRTLMEKVRAVDQEKEHVAKEGAAQHHSDLRRIRELKADHDEDVSVLERRTEKYVKALQEREGEYNEALNEQKHVTAVLQKAATFLVKHMRALLQHVEYLVDTQAQAVGAMGVGMGPGGESGGPRPSASKPIGQTPHFLLSHPRPMESHRAGVASESFPILPTIGVLPEPSPAGEGEGLGQESDVPVSPNSGVAGEGEGAAGAVAVSEEQVDDLTQRTRQLQMLVRQLNVFSKDSNPQGGYGPGVASMELSDALDALEAGQDYILTLHLDAPTGAGTGRQGGLGSGSGVDHDDEGGPSQSMLYGLQRAQGQGRRALPRSVKSVATQTASGPRLRFDDIHTDVRPWGAPSETQPQAKRNYLQHVGLTVKSSGAII